MRQRGASGRSGRKATARALVPAAPVRQLALLRAVRPRPAAAAEQPRRVEHTQQSRGADIGGRWAVKRNCKCTMQSIVAARRCRSATTCPTAGSSAHTKTFGAQLQVEMALPPLSYHTIVTGKQLSGLVTESQPRTERRKIARTNVHAHRSRTFISLCCAILNISACGCRVSRRACARAARVRALPRESFTFFRRDVLGRLP